MHDERQCTECAVLPRFLPFAILHFVGSGAFSRALRYWARFAATQARKHHPSANGFKLSDYGLVPILRKEPVRRESVSHGAEVGLNLFSASFLSPLEVDLAGLSQI